jgi:6-phosphogluconate dehydrogenase
MKNAMAMFVTPESVKRLSTAIGVPCAFSHDIAAIAQAFADLQDARHLADYDVLDPESIVGFSWGSGCIDQARHVFEIWDRVRLTDEARFFLASLVFGNKWAK